jgi:dipeptidase E
MRLFLSSYRFGNQPKKYAELLRVQKRVGIITNAQDVYPDPEVRQEKVQETIAELRTTGLRGEELDLRNYFGKQDALAERVNRYGGVWVRGGNCFVLRKAMRYSGFDELIKTLLASDSIAYGGSSAGACVMGKDMHGLDLCDEPTATPPGYKDEIIWEGLGIVPYAVVPHYKSDNPESALIDETVAYMDEHKLPFKTLRDGEAIVINDGKEVLLT